MEKKERARSRESKEKILRTTMQVFLKKGSYTATSTTDICRAAKIGRPTLYNYFNSKRNLFYSLHLDHMEKVLKPYLDEASSIDDPLARLVFMIHTFTGEVIGRHPELRFLIHDTLAIKDGYFRDTRRKWKHHYLLLRSTISELQQQGKARKDMSPSYAALFVLGMMTWGTFWLDFRRREGIDEIVKSAVDFALDGLKVKAPIP